LKDKQETYMTQLMAKIIDNLQISISNIHIRYEDRKSNPKVVFFKKILLFINFSIYYFLNIYILIKNLISHHFQLV